MGMLALFCITSLIISMVVASIYYVLTTRYDGTNFNYYKLRYFYGSNKIKKHFTEEYANIPVENFDSYSKFKWLLNLYSNWGLLGNFLRYNKSYINSREHIDYLLKWLKEDNVEYKDSHIISAISKNIHIDRVGFLNLYHIFDWSEDNIYNKFPIDLILNDWGVDHYETFKYLIDWKKASRLFRGLGLIELKDLKKNLVFEELKKNPCVNGVVLRKAFPEKFSNTPKLDIIDKLPPNSVRITDEIFRVGDDLYIKHESGYVKDLN